MLDPSSATELLTQQSINEPSITKAKSTIAKEKTEYIPPSGKSKYSSSHMQAKAPVPAPPTYGSEELYCKSHPDEEVRYFCFDCLTPPVCSECVVHGIHKGHEVQHIKKAFPMIKEKLEGVIQGLVTCVEDLESDRKGIIAKKQSVADQAEDLKGQMKTVLDDLRARIDKKERELLGHIDMTAGDALKELDSYERVVDEKLSTLANNVKYIQENMAGGPLATLGFYADNNKLLSQAAEQDTQKKEQYAAHLIASTAINPEGTLRDIKDAAVTVADAISKLRVSTAKFTSAASGEKKESAVPSGSIKRGIRDIVDEAALNDEYS